MNPITNALKNLSVSTVNILVALIFFVITAKITNPTFFGEVAIIQLLEVLATTFFALLSHQIVIREVSYMYAKNEIDKKFISTVLLTPLVVSPTFLILLFFPNYVKLAIPYLIMYLYGSYAISIMQGLNRYTEGTIGGIVFLVIRWLVSIIAVIQENIYLFVEIWLLGGVFSTIYSTIVIDKAVNGLPFYFNIDVAKKIFKEGIYLYLSRTAGFLSSQGDRVTTAYLLGSYYLGIYQFAALVASVPNMIIGSLTNVLLPSSSYYKALNKDELTMSRLSFKVTALLTFIIVILSIPLANYILPKLFPDYESGIQPMLILLLATTLPQPLGILTFFLVAFKKSLRPFLVLSIVSAITIPITSYLLIPRLGIIGGALSQLIVSIISSAFTLYYVLESGVFKPTIKEIGIISLIPIIFVYEMFIDPPLFDIVLLLIVILFFKLGRIFEREEKEIIYQFLPSRISFIKNIMRILL